MKFQFSHLAVAVIFICAGTAFAQTAAPAKAAPAAVKAAGPLAGQTVKIALIEGLSGPFGNVGQNQLKSWQFLMENLSGANNAAGVKFEIVGMDSKGSPQEALNTFKAAVDQGFRYITQGNGSGAALALSDAVAKHNERNPGKEVVYLNYAAVDPALTNEKCNYWHFRLDSDTTQKMEALTSFMKDQPSVKKVYLLNQNYSHGQQVARYFKEGMTRKRPDSTIVGEDLVPLGQVKDFAPYVAKIKQSGADTIVTGNWGADLTLLVKALNDAGMKIPMYTYYAAVSGTPTVLASGGEGEVYQISYAHSNYTGVMGKLTNEFQKKFGDDLYTFSIYNGLILMSDAMAKAKSIDPVKVAAAMSGLEIKGFNGDSSMRKSDHQMQQGLFISKWQKVDKKNPYSVEKTGYTFAPVKYIESYVASTPTSCQMKRPG